MATAVVTQAGIRAVVDAQADGFSGVQLATMRVVDDVGQNHDLALQAVAVVSPGVIQVSAADQTADAYTAESIDILTDTGVVFVEIRREAGEPNLYVKAGATSALSSFQLVVAAAGANPIIPAGNVTFTVQAATTNRAGIVELATQTEVNAGVDAGRAVTPLTLKRRLDSFRPPNASTARRGIVELATKAEALSRHADRVPTAENVGQMIDAKAPVHLYYNEVGLNIVTGAAGTLADLTDDIRNYRYIEVIGGKPAGEVSPVASRNRDAAAPKIVVANLPAAYDLYSHVNLVRDVQVFVWRSGSNLQLRGRSQGTRLFGVIGHPA